MGVFERKAVEDLESVLGPTGKAAVVLVERRVNYGVVGVIGSAAARCHLALGTISRSNYATVVPLECFLQLLIAIPMLVGSALQSRLH